MIIRNLTRSPITVFQKGFPGHSQVIGSTMQTHFAWSAIVGKDSEAVKVEGCDKDFTFSRKETIGKLLGCREPRKIKSSTAVENGIRVMTFLDERLLGLKIPDDNSRSEGAFADYLPSTMCMDFSVNMSGISLQM